MNKKSIKNFLLYMETINLFLIKKVFKSVFLNFVNVRNNLNMKYVRKSIQM